MNRHLFKEAALGLSIAVLTLVFVFGFSPALAAVARACGYGQ